MEDLCQAHEIAFLTLYILSFRRLCTRSRGNEYTRDIIVGLVVLYAIRVV
jgi:hypothetical protein